MEKIHIHEHHKLALKIMMDLRTTLPIVLMSCELQPVTFTFLVGYIHQTMSNVLDSSRQILSRQLSIKSLNCFGRNLATTVQMSKALHKTQFKFQIEKV